MSERLLIDNNNIILFNKNNDNINNNLLLHTTTQIHIRTSWFLIFLRGRSSVSIYILYLIYYIERERYTYTAPNVLVLLNSMCTVLKVNTSKYK